MDDSPRQADTAGPPAVTEQSDEELSDDERAVAAAEAERLVAATLRDAGSR